MARAEPATGRRISGGSLFARYISTFFLLPLREKVARSAGWGGSLFAKFFCLAGRTVFVTTR